MKYNAKTYKVIYENLLSNTNFLNPLFSSVLKTPLDIADCPIGVLVVLAARLEHTSIYT